MVGDGGSLYHITRGDAGPQLNLSHSLDTICPLSSLQQTMVRYWFPLAESGLQYFNFAAYVSSYIRSEILSYFTGSSVSCVCNTHKNHHFLHSNNTSGQPPSLMQWRVGGKFLSRARDLRLITFPIIITRWLQAGQRAILIEFIPAEWRVEQSRSQIQMKDHDVADASSLMP